MFKDKPWIYDHDEPLFRYSLGQEGKKPLVCFGVNPSTAKPGDLDPTVASVARFAHDHGYDGWLMFNLYPQRATNPDKMHKRFQKKTHQKNVEVIGRLVKSLTAHEVDVWCAWGTLIEKRPYLASCFQDIYETLKSSHPKFGFHSRGRVSKKGHPHHPLYIKKKAPLDTFDLNKYRRILNNVR